MANMEVFQIAGATLVFFMLFYAVYKIMKIDYKKPHKMHK